MNKFIHAMSLGFLVYFAEAVVSSTPLAGALPYVHDAVYTTFFFLLGAMACLSTIIVTLSMMLHAMGEPSGDEVDFYSKIATNSLLIVIFSLLASILVYQRYDNVLLFPLWVVLVYPLWKDSDTRIRNSKNETTS